MEPPDRVPRCAPGRSSAGRRVHRPEARDRRRRDHERPALLDGQDGVHPTRPGRAWRRRGADPDRLDDRDPRRRPARPDARCGRPSARLSRGGAGPGSGLPGAGDRRSTGRRRLRRHGRGPRAGRRLRSRHLRARARLGAACRCGRGTPAAPSGRLRPQDDPAPPRGAPVPRIDQCADGGVARGSLDRRACATARRRSVTRSASRRRSVATTDAARSGSPTATGRRGSTRPGAPWERSPSAPACCSSPSSSSPWSSRSSWAATWPAAPFRSPRPTTGTMPAS